MPMTEVASAIVKTEQSIKSMLKRMEEQDVRMEKLERVIGGQGDAKKKVGGLQSGKSPQSL